MTLPEQSNSHWTPEIGLGYTLATGKLWCDFDKFHELRRGTSRSPDLHARVRGKGRLGRTSRAVRGRCDRDLPAAVRDGQSLMSRSDTHSGS